jgi:hypothetical protein
MQLVMGLILIGVLAPAAFVQTTRQEAHESVAMAKDLHVVLLHRDGGFASGTSVLYRPTAAKPLQDQADLCGNGRDRADAEASYKEALTIYREFTAPNPATDLLEALKELNELYRDPQSLAEAQAVYKKALSIHGGLTPRNPRTYCSDRA